MIIKEDSILYVTEQAWKHKLSLAIGVISVFVLVGALYYFSYQSWQFLLCMAVVVVLSTASIFINFRIKCPECGSRWYWQALKTSVGDNGLGKFRSQKVCPNCGFSGDVGT